MNIALLKDVPSNVAAVIFSIGFIGGVFVVLIMMLLAGAGSGGAPRERKEKRSREESTHEIISAIRKRAQGEGGGVSFAGFIGFVLLVIIIALFFSSLVVIFRYIKEAQPNGEQFIPFFIRIVLVPLIQRFPALQGLVGGA